MKWLLEGYFCVCPRNNSLENIRIYERDFELSQIYFQKGVSFCCQNVRINRRVCFDRPKGGDRNQRENPRDDIFPVPQGKKAGPSVLQLWERELPCPWRWRRMRVRTEHFLLPAVQVVSRRCPAFGWIVGGWFTSSKGAKAVYCLRPTLSSRFQPGEILRYLRRHHSPQAENSQRPEKEGCLRTIRDEKTLILQAL